MRGADTHRLCALLDAPTASGSGYSGPHVMSKLKAEITANALILDQLHKHIHESVRFRDRSKSDRDRWSAFCKEFHRLYDELFFPGGSTRWEAFLSRDASETETAIAFLEADPWFFRSGYMKQQIWDHLKRASLTSKQERQLEAAAMAYLYRRVEREFWHMARYVRMRGSSAFWDAVTSLAATSAGKLSVKAGWLLLARQNVPVRNQISTELWRAK
jgi:hypothetical protein